MDSLKELIEQSEKLLNLAKGVKCDNTVLADKQKEVFAELENAKQDLKKTLEDVDSIK